MIATAAAAAAPQRRQRFTFTKAHRHVVTKDDHPSDPYISKLAKAFAATVRKFLGNVDLDKYARNLQGHGDPGRALDLSPLETALTVALAPLVTNLMELGANGEARKIFDFALTNLEAATAAQLFTNWLVKGISAETRQALQSIMYRAFTEGLAPRAAGKQIAGALAREPIDPRLAARFGVMSAGLNERLANAVFNYAQNLTTNGYSAAAVMAQSQRYADRLLDYRGDLIARTETIRASSIGQQALWNAAIGEGYLSTATATKVWSAAPSERTCGDCLDIDGQEVDVDGQFDTPWGSLDYPPGHGNCRCSAILRFPAVQEPREGAADRLAQATGSQLTTAVGNMPDLEG